MTVYLLSASGREVTIRTHYMTTDNAAARVALREADALHGSQGWRVLRVL